MSLALPWPVAWQLIRGGFRRHSAYRAAALAGALTNTVFGAIKASITLGALASAGGRLAGYDAKSAMTYVWLTQALIAPVSLFVWNEVSDRVRSGDIAVDLSRPVNVQLSYLCADLGRAAFEFLPRGLPPLLVGWASTGVHIPARPLVWAAGAAGLVLGVLVSFACRFLMNVTAFWLMEIRGVQTLYLVASNIFCGLLIPVHWFPGWLRTVANATPFPSILQTPVDLISGRYSGAAAAHALLTQSLWLLAMLTAGQVALARGSRVLVVQGG
ncbi:MAG: ABC-2 family transporter protein [Actinomycetales bacterium]|nr:ABC-2 family transporter protein [Actinomycetales bacterium]